MFTVAELTTPKTRAEWEESIYSTLSQLGVTTTNWKPGATVRAMVTVVSLMLAAESQLISTVAQSAFLDYATGDWLSLVASNVYGVDRNVATFASGSVTITNSGGAVYVLAAGDLILLNSTTGKTYRNTTALSIGSGATVTASILAIEEGSDSSADAGAIDAFETPLDGLTVTNATALVGVDAETDAALRLRCRESLGALSPNGPADAYAYFARSATRNTDGSSIGITRVRELKTGNGGLTVYVATASGGVTGTMTDTATDLGAIHDSLQKNACPLCVTLTTASATAHTIPVTYTVYAYNDSGMTSAEIQVAINTRLATWFSERPIGGDVVGGIGSVWREQIVAVIGATIPQICRVDVTSPAADVSILSNEVPVLGTVTATVNQIAKGGSVIQTFRDTIRRAVPPWMSGFWGSRLLYSWGVHMDVLGDMAVDAVKVRFPSKVDPTNATGAIGLFGEDALPPQGNDRQIIRGKAEAAAVYAARLQGYRQAHQHRGNPYELLRQVHAYYQGTVTAELVYNSGRKFTLASDGTITWGTQGSWTTDSVTQWSRWWLFYHWPSTVAGARVYGDGSTYGTGYVWGAGFTPEEIAELKTIPQAWNAAHSIGRLVVLNPGQTIGSVTWGTWANQIGLN